MAKIAEQRLGPARLLETSRFNCALALLRRSLCGAVDAGRRGGAEHLVAR
jgi:hypothetical protein